LENKIRDSYSVFIKDDKKCLFAPDHFIVHVHRDFLITLYKFSSDTELPLAFACLHELGKISTYHWVRKPTSEKDELSISGFECFTLGKGVRCIHECFLEVDFR